MVVAKVGFMAKGSLSSIYSYLVDESLCAKLDPGQWVIVESDRQKYSVAVFMGMSEDQDYASKPYAMKNIVMATELPKEEV